MKKIFALMIAGSFLFIGCGGAAGDAEAMFDKECECKQLAKDKDNKEGAEACVKELKEMSKEMKDKYKDMATEDLKEARKEAEEAVKGKKCE